MFWQLASRPPFLMNALRWMTWSCVLLLGVLSLLPGADMVRTGAPGELEHYVAYAATGAIAMGAYGPSQGGSRLIGALWLYAALLEYLQHFSPGRQPAVEDFAASAVGALSGVMVIAFLRRWWRASLER